MNSNNQTNNNSSNINDIDNINVTDNQDISSSTDALTSINDTDNKNTSGTINKKKKFSIGNIIRYVIMAASAVIFLYSAFMLFKIYLDYKQGTDTYKAIENDVLKPIETSASGDVLPFIYDHDALLNINSEGIGYLYVPSINLRLPMVQGTDNDYYLNHTFNRTYNGAGCLFEDSRINNGLAASHVIIYGHNMRNGSMFAGLSKYLTPSFYTEDENNVFYIYTENKLMKYEIFSAYICEPSGPTYSYNFSSQTALREYAKEMKTLSSYNTNVDVSNATQIVTFSTCTGDGEQRIIVQGTYVSESSLE